MAPMIILAKTDSLRRCINRIEEKTPSKSDVLQRDLDLQDIISVNLERAVQCCVDIAAHALAMSNEPPPSTMSEGFEMLGQLGVIDDKTAQRMKSAVGFRNISVHEYQKIDWQIVYTIITVHLDDFKEFIRQVVVWMERQDSL